MSFCKIQLSWSLGEVDHRRKREEPCRKALCSGSFQALIQCSHPLAEALSPSINLVTSPSFKTLLGYSPASSPIFSESTLGTLVSHHLCLCGPFWLETKRNKQNTPPNLLSFPGCVCVSFLLWRLPWPSIYTSTSQPELVLLFWVCPDYVIAKCSRTRVHMCTHILSACEASCGLSHIFPPHVVQC